jgi:class 3 adenylate cyclase
MLGPGSTQTDAMETIVEWLDALGLGRYGAAFAEADIDSAVLRDLNDTDLRQLGVSPGHRKRLLRAIAELSETQSDAPAPPEPRASEAERRQLSVLFCDLVGSTALASRLDPEDMGELLGAYHRCCTEVIERLGGFIGKYMGDGVLAYFGYPYAGEDDPERAVAAGLELVRTVRHIHPGAVLEVRIGVASGLVVVGDLIGRRAAQEQAVVGETPSLAVRLQGLAEPGMVLVGPRTRRLLGRLFEYRELGPVALPGAAEPQPVFAVLRRSAVHSRFEARQDGELAPLVGRAAELDLLRDRWREASAGSGGVVVLSGEAGIGKSRIAQAFQDWLGDQPRRRRLRYYCSPLHQDSALHPFVAQFEHSVGFQHDDAPAQKLDKLDALFDRLGTIAQDRALIAALLALPGAERYGPPLPAPAERKRGTLDAIIRHLCALAHEQPLLLLFEDVQWIDPTSCELLDRIAELVPHLPALLLVTGRPEFDAAWTSQPRVATLALGRLDRGDCVALVGGIAGRALPADLVETIVRRGDGVPLFIEEVTRAVLEIEPGAPSAAVIPSSLIASLTARLDRLGPAKEVAQIGAVLGREFTYELLAAVAGRPDQELRAALERLSAAGLLLRRGAADQATYVFKHTLLQDTAYDALLRAPRRDWHARIAKTIATRFPEIAETRPAVLARHYTESGSPEDAITWWERAAERALAPSAHVEAVSHLKSALALLGELAAAGRHEREVRLRLKLVAPLVATTGLASRESEENYVRITALTQQQAKLSRELLHVLWGRAAMLVVRSDLDRADELGELFVARAAAASLPNGACIGLLLLSYAALLRGDMRRARRQFDRSQAHYVREARVVFPGYPLDLHAAMLCHEALLLQQEGASDRAAARCAEALALAKAGKPATAEAYVLLHVALTELIAGDRPRVAAAAERFAALTERIDLDYYRWHVEVLRGWVEAGSGTLDAGLARIRGGLELRHRYLANAWVPVYLLCQAELLLRSGSPDAALAVLDDCAAQMRALQQHYGEPELHRLRAVALRAAGADFATADAAFANAVDTARRRGLKLYELRAAAGRALLSA